MVLARNSDTGEAACRHGGEDARINNNSGRAQGGGTDVATHVVAIVIIIVVIVVIILIIIFGRIAVSSYRKPVEKPYVRPSVRQCISRTIVSQVIISSPVDEGPNSDNETTTWVAAADYQ